MSWESVSFWIEHHPGLASWVQAVGSIGAILVAIWISGGEMRHRLKVEKAARRDALVRAIDASEHARKIAQNNVDFFTSGHLPRSEMPRYLAVVDHASARLKEVLVGPGIDNEILGHLYEVSNSLVDVKGLIEQCVSSLEDKPTLQISYFKSNVKRIEKAISALRAIKKQ